MHVSSLRTGIAVLAGIIIAVLIVVALSGLGYGASQLVSDDPSQAELAKRGLLWGGSSIIIAFAAGGWLAARLTPGHRVRHGALAGLVVGVLTLLVILWVAEAILGASADFRSVRVALGLIDAADPSTINLPVPIATPASGLSENQPLDRSRERVIDAIWYTGAVLVLFLGAAALGGVAGSRPDSGANRHP